MSTKRGTLSIVSITLASALLAFTPGATAHQSDEHGVITVHDNQDGPHVGDNNEVHCEFWVRGHDLDGPKGRIWAAYFLGSPSARTEALADWSGVENLDGTFDFEAGPFVVDEGQDIFELFIFAQVGVDEETNHTSFWVPLDYKQCLPPSACPPDATLSATPHEDGTVTVEAHGLDREAQLRRTLAGTTHESVQMATMDAENRTFHDSTTEPGSPYEYQLLVDNETCAMLHVTAIPFFPGPLMVLGMVGTVAAVHLVLRRRL